MKHLKLHRNPTINDTRLDKKYNVRRSNGTVETDWKLREAHIASTYNIIVSPRERVMVLFKPHKNGGEMTKAVPCSNFIKLNPTY